MMVTTRGMNSYCVGELVGRRTVAAGDKAWGSGLRGFSKASTGGLDCVGDAVAEFGAVATVVAFVGAVGEARSGALSRPFEHECCDECSKVVADEHFFGEALVREGRRRGRQQKQSR